MSQALRIAIVEDNADNRLLLTVLLEELYQIASYESGPEALVGLRASPPDLVLMDISLPEMDGVEVLSLMRADDTLAHLPVIALTAHNMRGDRERFLAAGFDDFVTKPIVDEEVLLGAVERCLRAGRSTS